MKKILAISDTHLQEGAGVPKPLIDLSGEADLVLHAGDFVSLEAYEAFRDLAPFEAVSGNSDDPAGYIGQVERAVAESDFDLLAVSAGFDTYVLDWGGLLSLSDYNKIGRVLREGAEKKCAGRRFAVLEGGYHPDLPLCIRSFVGGFEGP